MMYVVWKGNKRFHKSVDGGPSGGSSMHRPLSEDRRRRLRYFSYIQIATLGPKPGLFKSCHPYLCYVVFVTSCLLKERVK